MERNTCCFTGHRKISSAEIPALRDRLLRTVTLLIEKGYTDFVAGGALGFDTLAAQAVLKAKESFPHIALRLVLPCPEQMKLWNEQQKAEYTDILNRADSCEYVCDRYTRWCMAQRNKRMVEMSSAVVAYYNGDGKGGTAMTVGFAEKKNLGVINLF